MSQSDNGSTRSGETIILKQAIKTCLANNDIKESESNTILNLWQEIQQSESDRSQRYQKLKAKIGQSYGPRASKLWELVNENVTVTKAKFANIRNQQQQQQQQQLNNSHPQATAQQQAQYQYQIQQQQQQQYQYNQQANIGGENIKYQGKGISNFQPQALHQSLQSINHHQSMQQMQTQPISGSIPSYPLLLQSHQTIHGQPMYGSSNNVSLPSLSSYQQPNYQYPQNSQLLQIQNSMHLQNHNAPNNAIVYNQSQIMQNPNYQQSVNPRNMMHNNQQIMIPQQTHQHLSSNNLSANSIDAAIKLNQNNIFQINPDAKADNIMNEADDKKKKKTAASKKNRPMESSSPDNNNMEERQLENKEDKKTPKKRKPAKDKTKGNDEDDDNDNQLEEGDAEKKKETKKKYYKEKKKEDNADNDLNDNPNELNKNSREQKEKKTKPKKTPEEIEENKKLLALKKKVQTQKTDNIAMNASFNSQNNSNNNIGDENKGVDSLLERPNILAEGMEVVNNKSVTAPVLSFSNNFVQDEASLSKKQLRLDVASIINKKDEYLNPPPGYVPDLEPGQEWQYYNIMDKILLDEIINKVTTIKGFTISNEALTFLSNGLQVYLKNSFESSLKNCKNRICKFSMGSLNTIYKTICLNKGEAGPENRLNIAIKFGPDNKGFLEKAETNSRKYIREMNNNDESELKEEMKSFDDKYITSITSSVGGKRKLQTSDGNNNESIETPWWIKEETVEKSGVLNLIQLSESHFKRNVADKYSLGMFNNEIVSKKAKFSKNNDNSNNRRTIDTCLMDVDTVNGPSLTSSRSNRVPFCPLIVYSSTIIVEDDVYNSLKLSNVDCDSKVISRIKMNI